MKTLKVAALVAALFAFAPIAAAQTTTRTETVVSTGSFAQTSGIAVAGPGASPASAASAQSYQSSGNYGNLSSQTYVYGGTVSTYTETNNSSYTNGESSVVRIGNGGAEATYYGDANGYMYNRVTVRRR